MSIFVKVAITVIGLILLFLLFVPIQTTYYYDSSVKEMQLVEVEKPLKYVVDEHHEYEGKEKLPYVIVKNIDDSYGYFRIILWSVSALDEDYENYRDSTEYVNDTPTEYLHPEAVISFKDFIDRLYPTNKFEWTVWLLPMHEITVQYPKIDDEYAYDESMWEWGYDVESLTLKKTMEPQLLPKKISTYVPLATYWLGSDAADWVQNSIFYAVLIIIVSWILYKVLIK